jgi:hypothetical protein
VYDVAWTEAEVDVLEDYARLGGLLVLTNSAYYNDFVNRPATVNEDWADMNAVGARFGVTFKEELVAADRVMPESGTPFTEDVAWLAMLEANAVPFDLTEGRVLAAVDGRNVMAHISVGEDGEVLGRCGYVRYAIRADAAECAVLEIRSVCGRAVGLPAQVNG